MEMAQIGPKSTPELVLDHLNYALNGVETLIHLGTTRGDAPHPKDPLVRAVVI